MDTRTYVSDNLIKLVGGSEDMTIDFVLQTAKTAKSPTMLFDKLSTMLDSGDAELQRFSEDLFARIAKPSSGSGGSGATQNVKPKQPKKKYALVDMPEEEEVVIEEKIASHLEIHRPGRAKLFDLLGERTLPAFFAV